MARSQGRTYSISSRFIYCEVSKVAIRDRWAVVRFSVNLVLCSHVLVLMYFYCPMILPSLTHSLTHSLTLTLSLSLSLSLTHSLARSLSLSPPPSPSLSYMCAHTHTHTFIHSQMFQVNRCYQKSYQTSPKMYFR